MIAKGEYGVIVKMISLEQVQDLIFDYLDGCKYYEASGRDAAEDICGLIGMCDIIDVEVNDETILTKENTYS